VPTQSVTALDGLSPAEVVHLIVFAANADLRLETGATEDGSPFVALRPQGSVGRDDGGATWTVSREKGRVLAFNEMHGQLPHRQGVPDLLRDLSRVLPLNQAAIRH
jgi:hypothetical protein